MLFRSVLPDGWTYDGSLSQSARRVESEEELARLQFLESDGEMDTFLNPETGRPVYVPTRRQ